MQGKIEEMSGTKLYLVMKVGSYFFKTIQMIGSGEHQKKDIKKNI